ncbi:MAG: ABC transporter ATP-binding protein [Candidatus Saccharibacteria bacterium]|nr:ABC transporter ATP-binding protein [Candidatus Saccharibacteria bacterium]
MSYIKLDNVSQVFGFGNTTRVALQQINLNIEAKSFVIIMGQSGSGKTSLLNILGLIRQPIQGVYNLSGQAVTELSNSARAKLRRQKIGFLFENFNLSPNLNVFDNVSLPIIYNRPLNFTSRSNLVKEALNRLGLHNKEFLYPKQLSLAQAQRVAIARAIIHKPDLIIADEPTGRLDSKATDMIMKILKTLNQQGITIIMATHNPFLSQYANRFVYLHDGFLKVNQTLQPNQQIDITKIQEAIQKQAWRRKNKSASTDQLVKTKTGLRD